DWDVSAVYRAVGYLSDQLPKLPWDIDSGTVPDRGGRVVQENGEHLPSTYVTGWIKRGPVGLIGHTKGDANETVANLLEDLAAGRLNTPAEPDPEAVVKFIEDKQLPYTTWQGWYRLDAYERSLGENEGRERVKVVEREDMFRASEPHKS